LALLLRQRERTDAALVSLSHPRSRVPKRLNENRVAKTMATNTTVLVRSFAAIEWLIREWKINAGVRM